MYLLSEGVTFLGHVKGIQLGGKKFRTLHKWSEYAPRQIAPITNFVHVLLLYVDSVHTKERILHIYTQVNLIRRR